MVIAIGTPYKENSITAIARRAVERQVLDAFYTTIYTAPILNSLNRLRRGKYGSTLVRELQRRAYPGIPGERIITLATGWDLALLALRRLGLSQQSARYVFTSKRRFDEAMSLRVRRSRATDVVGMWGSCEATFRMARHIGRHTVMNYVNSHPEEQNRLIREFGGAPAGHHEFVPGHVITQVQREMESADLLLVPSYFVAKQLLSRGIDAERIAVEPYGVSVGAFTPPIIPRDYGERRPLRVLCVALISYRKGIPNLLAAARKIKGDAQFDLIGPIIEPSLLRNLPDNVTYHGMKVQSDVVSAMQSADVLVLPSVEDACPLVILEAMATALPVVVSDHAGGGESVIEGKTGFVFPVADVDRFVSCLQLLQGDSDLRQRMGQAGRAQVEAAARWDSYADRVLERISGNRDALGLPCTA